jgi:hypothetical protein
VANSATASASRPSKGVAPGLRGNGLLLQARQQPLPFGQGQPQAGDLTEIIRSVDRQDVNRLVLTVSREFHQPHNPRHASTSDQRTDAKIPLRRSHPQTCDGPCFGVEPIRRSLLPRLHCEDDCPLAGGSTPVRGTPQRSYSGTDTFLMLLAAGKPELPPNGVACS